MIQQDRQKIYIYLSNFMYIRKYRPQIPKNAHLILAAKSTQNSSCASSKLLYIDNSLFGRLYFGHKIQTKHKGGHRC